MPGRAAEAIEKALKGWCQQPRVDFARDLISHVAGNPDRYWLASVALRVLGSSQTKGLSPFELEIYKEARRAFLWLTGYVKLAGNASQDPQGFLDLAQERIKQACEQRVLDVHLLRARFIHFMPDMASSVQSGLDILGNPALIARLNEGQPGSRGESPQILMDRGARLAIDFCRNEVHSAKRSAVRFGIPLELQLLGLLRFLASQELPIARSLLINELWNEPEASKTILDMRFQKLLERIQGVHEIRICLQSERAWSRGPCVANIHEADLSQVVVLSDIHANRPGVLDLGNRVSARLLQEYYGISASHARRVRAQLVVSGVILEGN